MRHPECRLDEIFVTNADSESWLMVGWNTKRKGHVAYSVSGYPLAEQWPGGFPVFVKMSEIERANPSALASLERFNENLKYNT